MANALIARLNWVWESPAIAFSGGAWVASLPLTNLLDDRTLHYARTASADPADTRFAMDFGVVRRIDHVWLGYLNATDAALVRISIGGAPLDIDWTAQAAETVPAGWTFGRSSDGYYVDGSGVMVLAAAGEPRYDHDPLTGAPLGLLIEGFASAQLLANPEALGSWTTSGTTVSSNAAAAPNGATEADRLVEASGTSAHGITQAKTFAASQGYIFSGHFKAQQREWLCLKIDDGVAAKWAFFRLAGAGTVGHLSSGVTAKIQQLAGGWFRVSMRMVTASGAGAGTLAVYLATADGTDANPSYAGNTSNGLLGWGMKLEVTGTSLYPSSYLAGDRAAETMVLSGAALAFHIPADIAGVTLAAAFSMPVVHAASTDYWVAQIDDGAGDNRVGLEQFNAPSVAARVDAATSIVAALTLGTGAFDGTLKTAAVAVAANDVRAALAGTLSSHDTVAAFPTGLNRISLGGPAPVHIRRLLAFGARLTDADIEAGTVALDALGSSYPSVTGGWVAYVPTTQAPSGGYIAYGRPSNGQLPADERDPRGVSRLFVLLAGVDVSRLSFEFRDAGNPDGFLQISMLWAGMSVRPAINLQNGFTIGPIAEMNRRRSRGGTLHKRELWRRRRASGALRWQHRDLALATWLETAIARGGTGPILLCADPEGGIHVDRLTILGVLEEPTPVEHQQNYRWGWPIAIVEL
ncbi:MAG: hypothetical protein AB7P02_14855 [Alphaproteobacteria bacterium]